MKKKLLFKGLTSIFLFIFLFIFSSSVTHASLCPSTDCTFTTKEELMEIKISTALENHPVSLEITNPSGELFCFYFGPDISNTDEDGKLTLGIKTTISVFDDAFAEGNGEYTISVGEKNLLDNCIYNGIPCGGAWCTKKFSVIDKQFVSGAYDICQGNQKCNECQDGGGSWTALGCIPTDPSSFVAWVLSFAIKIGGGIAILLIIIGGIQVLTSAGNPDKVKAGKELITSAVSGLLLIVFAVFLLKLIGKDILKIPDFEP